jgi:hypothetical protein
LGSAKAPRRQVGVALERAGEVALVYEAGRNRHLGQRQITLNEPTGGPGEAQAPCVIADGDAQVAAKDARQVDRVHAGYLRYIGRSKSNCLHSVYIGSTCGAPKVLQLRLGAAAPAEEQALKLTKEGRCRITSCS